MNFQKIIALLLSMAMLICTLSSCEPGPQGVQGEKGDKGEVGATIQKVEFDEQGRLVITLTDGTVLSAIEMPKPGGTEGLEYYPLLDGTVGVSAGTTKYLEEIEIPATYNGKAVTKIVDSAFQNASNLKKITIPDSVTSIGVNAFSGCANLIQVEGGVSYVDRWVIDCDTSMTSVVLRANTVGIGDSAFESCYDLTNVTIPKSVTSIGDYAFYYCTSLTSVTIPNSVRSIGDWAFYNCDSFVSIKIPDSVTSIGDRSFSECTFLKYITISNSVTSIGEDAFFHCDSLANVYYGGTEGEWAEISVPYFGNAELTYATRYYYSETIPTDDGNYWHYVDGVPTKW